MRQMKKIAVTTLSIALALSLTSCYGAGPEAATRMVNRVTDGAEAVVNTDGSDIRVSNLLLVATEDGSAVVVGHIVNRADSTDEILGITVGGVGATISGETKLFTNKPIHFEGEQANAKAVFPGVGAQAGRNVDLTIGFARAGLVTVRAIIRDKSDIYADVTSGAKLETPAN
ncbi:hypothetical protein MCEMRE196_00087 [Candidatus Nanopelagicaceae bacterium]